MEDRVMASPLAISIVAMAGVMNVAVGVSKLFIGFWGFTIGWCVLSTVWFYLAFRLSRYPVVLFDKNYIAVLSRPAFPPKQFPIQDIKDIKVGYLDAKILLINGKSIKLPLSCMKKSDRQSVLNRIKISIGEIKQTEQI